jgi:cytochrome c
MKLAFESVAAPGQDAKDKVHVYWTERKGKLRKYDAVRKQVVTLGQINMTLGAQSSDGLLGIALDPNFKSNHNLYLYYSKGTNPNATWRVSRFTLDAAHETLNMGSEKVILDVPIELGAQHPGGALQMEPNGDLWITTGDNHMPTGSDFLVHTSANTNDLRAKILRIRPKADGSGYDIPAGNLFPPGTPKARPEIYVMGNRNPYTMYVDPVRHWVVWGEVGPDDKNMDGLPMNQAGSTDMTEEYNLATAPGNYGYPFFAGKNFALKSGINATAPAIPAGTNWNGAQEGMANLPAAQPAIKAYKKACAITGPIYRYDGALNSSIKFPPHFHLKWLTTDFNANQGNVINLYTLNESGSAITKEEQVLKSVILYKPLDMQFGPDGALYVNNYSGYRTASATTGIVRVEYTGTCRPAEPTGLARGHQGPAGHRIGILQGRGLSVNASAPGDFTVEVRDFQGRPVASRSGTDQGRFAFAEVRQGGVYVVRLVSAEGVSSRLVLRE